SVGPPPSQMLVRPYRNGLSAPPFARLPLRQAAPFDAVESYALHLPYLIPRLERFSEAADQPVSQFFGFVDGEDQRSRRLQRDSESVFIGVDTKHDAGASTEDKVTFARGRFDWHGFPYPMVMASRRA